MHQSGMDPYAVLGVGRDVSLLEIARARRTLAKRLHPDVTPDADSLAKMQALNAAWELLSDPVARLAWDNAHRAVDVDTERRHWTPTVERRREAWVEWPDARSTRYERSVAEDHEGITVWVVLFAVLVLMVLVLIGGIAAAASRDPTLPVLEDRVQDNLDY